MGFTIETYQLLGLPLLPNIYVSIQGSYSIKKNRPVQGYYQIFCTAYFSASKNDPVITEKEMNFSIQTLPEPATLYTEIYSHIKETLDPEYTTEKQTLVFIDD